ncbi:ABC transporter substrate-binding protein [Reichenbachiella sp. MALMAid0571]|uniref:ABC transporter substrate-binding protein n=1 Tax=Reichenbachiella sp. MALMAid0571 TaxID=3143939 RepID=UPI0032DFCA83
MSNNSELFIDNQLFEGLFQKNSNNEVVPQLIKEYSLDTLNKTYYFTLNKNKKWSDGSRVTTNDIYNCFKSIIEEANSDKLIQFFSKNLNASSKFRRELNGFKIIDDITFSIQVNEQENFLQTLTDYRFWIYKKTSNQEIIGSGPFKIKNTNDDISFNLDRNPYHSLEKKNNTFSGIDIRFIKNDNALIDEFLNGSIDAIEYNPAKQEIKELEAIKNNKYGYKNYAEQNKIFIQYLIFRNFNSLQQIRSILKKFPASILLKEKNWMNFSNVDSTRTSKFVSSKENSLKPTQISVVYSSPTDSIQLTKLIKPEFSPEIKLILTKKEGVNLNMKYIVIKNGIFEAPEPTINEDYLQVLEPSIYNDQQNIVIAEVSSNRNLVIFDERIKGFKKYGDWTKDIKNLTYSEPTTF